MAFPARQSLKFATVSRPISRIDSESHPAVQLFGTNVLLNSSQPKTTVLIANKAVRTAHPSPHQ